MSRAIGKYRLEVIYPTDFGRHNLDVRITKLVGKRDWASGQGCGERDMCFDFTTAAARDRAKARVEKENMAGVRINCYESSDD